MILVLGDRFRPVLPVPLFEHVLKVTPRLNGVSVLELRDRLAHLPIVRSSQAPGNPPGRGASSTRQTE